MYVRKKKNPSGVISIQIIDKSSGKYKVLKTIGSSSNSKEVEELFNKGKEWINQKTGALELDFGDKTHKIKEVLQKIDQINVKGIELLLGGLYDEIGFNAIDNGILKYLAILRISNPASKLKTIDLLSKYHSIDVEEHKMYRYLDKLHRQQKEDIQQISYKHTRKILNGVISIVFYDVTTLYFQIDNEDELRKRGFSKEARHQNPQIVLGLLVSIDGYPLAFDVFQGNKFEGHTMLPVLDTFKEKYNLDKLVVIADSGLLSSQNIEALQKKGYEFILGARIKSESNELKKKIIALHLKNGESKIIEKDKGLKLIISYSDKRAKKDAYNRQRGLKRLEKQLKSGKLNKTHINNRGYNKYLKLEGNMHIEIDYQKYQKDAMWDGLKGYISNTNLTKDEIIENYGHLWKIEKAFRISKHDLKIRPIYHRLRRRIEAHITINFIAYKIYKELERQLKEKKANISAEKAIAIAKTIYELRVKTDHNQGYISEVLLLNDDQRELAKMFEF